MYLHKRKKGSSTVYYLCKNGRVDGKSTIVWQKHIGTADKIAKIVEAHSELDYIKFHTFPYGKLAAFMSIADELKMADTINDNTTKKKVGGLTVGEYMTLIILNRLTKPASKNKLGEWFNRTFLKLVWEFDHKLNEQNFWNHMEKLDNKAMEGIELDITKTLAEKGITPEHVILDTTNFFTYMEENTLLKKGKSKDGKHGKNLLGFGLAVSQDNIPFVHTLYEGNEPDSKIFTKMVDRIMDVLKKADIDTEKLVAIFDKGNNSKDNINGLDMSFVGSLKRSQVRDLLDVPLSRYKKLYTNGKGNDIYGYRTGREVFGEEYVVVVSYNPETRKKEQKRMETNLKKAKERLGKLGAGRKYDSFVRSVEDAIPKDVKSIVRYKIRGKFEVEWWIDEDVKRGREKGFGKTIVFTDLEDWETSDIVKTYNSKHLVEDDFKLLKDRIVIPIPPVYHRLESMQRVHVFLCVISLLLLRYLLWKCRDFGLSRNRLMEELEGIRIGVVKDKKSGKSRLVYEQMSLLQGRLMTYLDLGRYVEK